jgi:hypothetical protein
MGLGSGIRDQGSGKNPFRIPDPGVKKAPDPGSGSATLLFFGKSLSLESVLWIHDILVRSGSAYPCLRLIYPDPDPAIFVIDLQDANSACYFLKVHFHNFSKIKI